MTRRRRRQLGSVMVLAAAMMMLLIGFLGLVVDGGEISSATRAAQNAADGAALAAAYDVLNNGSQPGYVINANPDAVAKAVGAANGMATSEVTMTYLTSARVPTTTPSAVAYVDAAVSHNFPTLFLPIIGIDSASLTAQAEVGLQPVSVQCAICVLGTSGTVFTQRGSTVTAYLAPIMVNSSSASAMNITGPGSVVDAKLFGFFGPTPYIYVGTGGTATSNGGGTYTPAITAFSPTPDPFGTLAQPPTSKTPTTVQADVTILAGDAGNYVINPGIYNKIEFNGTGSLTFNPGTYVVRTDMQLTGTGYVQGWGVTFYFTCATYPTTGCSGPGAPLTWTGSNVSLIGETAGGEFPFMLIMYDRGNTSGLTIAPTAGGGTIGSIYAPASLLSFGGAGFFCYSQIVVGSIDMNLTSAGYFFYYSTQNYQPQAALVLLK